MSETETSNAVSQAAASSVPTQFHLHGHGISVAYFPDGRGPVTVQGPIYFTYQDAHVALIFHANDVRTAQVADLGTIVSVTLKETVDVGSTTFSVLIPRVRVPAQGAAATVATDGITTVHKTPLIAIGYAQMDTYTVTALTGSASAGVLPL